MVLGLTANKPTWRRNLWSWDSQLSLSVLNLKIYIITYILYITLYILILYLCLMLKYLALLKGFFAFAEDEHDSQVMNPAGIRDDTVGRKLRKNKRFGWGRGSHFHQLKLLVSLALNGKLDSARSGTETGSWVHLQRFKLNIELCGIFRKRRMW